MSFQLSLDLWNPLLICLSHLPSLLRYPFILSRSYNWMVFLPRFSKVYLYNIVQKMNINCFRCGSYGERNTLKYIVHIYFSLLYSSIYCCISLLILPLVPLFTHPFIYSYVRPSLQLMPQNIPQYIYKLYKFKKYSLMYCCLFRSTHSTGPIL